MTGCAILESIQKDLCILKREHKLSWRCLSPVGISICKGAEDMKITITGRKTNIRESFKEKVEKKLAKLDRFFDDDARVVVTVTNAQRLDAAMQIAQQLEQNQIMGQAASVDVEKMGNITLWYGTQYQVKLGTAEGLDSKITALAQAIKDLSDYQSGVLDVTFERDSKIYYYPF